MSRTSFVNANEIILVGEAEEIRKVLDEIDENEDVLMSLIYVAGRSRITEYLEEYLKDGDRDDLYEDIKKLVALLKIKR